MLTVSFFLTSEATLIRILSFRRRSLSETTETLTFEIQKIWFFEKYNILKFIRPKPNIFFNYCNFKGIIRITRLNLELRLLLEHKFIFLLHSPIFNDKRHTRLSTFNNIDSKILESTDFYLTKTLLW